MIVPEKMVKKTWAWMIVESFVVEIVVVQVGRG